MSSQLGAYLSDCAVATPNEACENIDGLCMVGIVCMGCMVGMVRMALMRAQACEDANLNFYFYSDSHSYSSNTKCTVSTLQNQFCSVMQSIKVLTITQPFEGGYIGGGGIWDDFIYCEGKLPTQPLYGWILGG